MNKHIELVKKWLADNESVSQQELKDNAISANVAAAAYADPPDAAAYVADAAYAAYADPADAAYWVERYEELTK